MTALEVYNPGTIGESIVVFGNLADRISRTDFVPQEFRGRPEAVLACMMYGQELGLGPMQSLNLTQSIKGRVGLKPEGMRALVLAAGHKIWTEEFTDARVVLCGQRHGEDEVERVDWDLDRAKKAGLGTGDNWKKYPRAMLLARATSELCRLKFADIVGGLSYTPDELEEFEPVAVAPPPAASRRRSAPVAELTPAADVEEVVETPRGALTHTRPRDMDRVVDTGELPPSTGTRKRKPPTARQDSDIEPGSEFDGPTPMSGREAAQRPADAALVAQVSDVIDALKELGEDAAQAGREAWKAAGVPVRAADQLLHADAERALEVLSGVYRARLNTAPMLDAS